MHAQACAGDWCCDFQRLMRSSSLRATGSCDRLLMCLPAGKLQAKRSGDAFRIGDAEEFSAL
jgi:hypothetical protein